MSSEGLLIIIFMIFICPPSTGEVGTATHYCLHQVIFPGLIYNPFGPRIRRPHCLEPTVIAEKTKKRNRSARCMASLEQAERWLGYTKNPPYVIPRIGGCYGRAFDKRNCRPPAKAAGKGPYSANSAATKTVNQVNLGPFQRRFPT